LLILLYYWYNYKITINWLKQKRVLWIVLAIVFLIVLFSLKTGFFSSLFKDKNALQTQQDGLVYGNETIADLVNKDTDSDGILDWQENLYGLDPTKKETTPGTPDSLAMNKLKTGQETSTIISKNNVTAEENLTETEKFSRELFATVAAASQGGTVDQTTIDALGESLAERIQNSPQRKIYTTSDIKITNDNSAQAYKNYGDTLNELFVKYSTIKYGVLDVLQEFIVDENSVDIKALEKLDPIISQTNKIKSGMIKINVPQPISTLHLNVINNLEGLIENLNDIKLYESDSIMSLGGITKYGENASNLVSNLTSLTNTITQKIGNQ